MQHPEPVGDIDAKLVKTMTSIHRIRWIAIMVLGILVVIAIGTMAIVISAQQDQLRSDCEVWGSLSGLPVTIPQGAKRPAQFSVVIIAESRVAFSGKGCGKLPPADPSELHWAAYYNVKVVS